MKGNLFFPLLAGILSLFSSSVSAQQETSITIPSTPAFSILNYEPAAVMRPGNPKELSADILNSFDKEGKLLLNAGMEVGPYWLSSRPYLTRAQYLEPSMTQAFLQSLLLSAATVKDTVSKANKLGTGIRFKLFNGKTTNDYTVKEAELNQALTITATIAASRALIGTSINSKEAAIEFIITTLQGLGYSDLLVQNIQREANERSANFGESVADITSFVTDLNNAIDTSNNNLKVKVAELSRKRVGFILEVAGASSFYMSPVKKNNAFERAGVWVTASNFVTEHDALNISARYFLTSKDSVMTNFDLGLSYIKELNNFSLSLEGMGRFYEIENPDFNSRNEPVTVTEKDFTYRLAVQSAYKLTDELSINLSLGKDFDHPTIESSSFFSIVGFNYSIFNKSKVNLAP